MSDFADGSDATIEEAQRAIGVLNSLLMLSDKTGAPVFILDDFHDDAPKLLVLAFRTVILAEREACAKLCDDAHRLEAHPDDFFGYQRLAEEVRRR